MMREITALFAVFFVGVGCRHLEVNKITPRKIASSNDPEAVKSLTGVEWQGLCEIQRNFRFNLKHLPDGKYEWTLASDTKSAVTGHFTYAGDRLKFFSADRLMLSCLRKTGDFRILGEVYADGLSCSLNQSALKKEFQSWGCESALFVKSDAKLPPLDVNEPLPPVAETKVCSYTNPLIPAEASDPWVLKYDGDYYLLLSGRDEVKIRKMKRLEEMGLVNAGIVWNSAQGGGFFGEIRAPELHYLDGKFYIYASAVEKASGIKKMFVLQSNSADPLGTYSFQSVIGPENGVDPTVYEYQGTRYFLWSQSKGSRQCINMAKMDSPLALSAESSQEITCSTMAWERAGGDILANPEFHLNGNILYIVYSAGSPAHKDAAFGSLIYKPTGGGFFWGAATGFSDPRSWRKYGEPVFSATERVVGVSSGVFTKSSNDKVNWMIYQALDQVDGGLKSRSIRMQGFGENNGNGYPDFNSPATSGRKMLCPE